MPFFFPFGLVEIGLVVLVVVALILVGRRIAPDPTGRRPFAIYLLSVMFLTLFTTAAAVGQIGSTLADLVKDEHVVEPPVAPPIPGPVATLEPIEQIPRESRPVGGFLAAPPDQTLSKVLESGFVGLLGLAIFEFHRRQWRVLLSREISHG
jgi:hypothetical protein